MIKGIVESISKTAVVVTINSEARTLTGKAVEKLVGELKLGDEVEFDHNETPTKFKRPAVKTASSGSTERRNSSSPAAPVKQHIYY